MAAYAIVDLEVFDIELYLRYSLAMRPLLEAAGARYLARGGEFLVLEGDYQPSRLILVEFPSLARMESFFESESYQALEIQRRECSKANIVGVAGL